MLKMIRKIRISRKLLLISLTYTAPIAPLAAYLISATNKDINFARMEKFGNEYQRPLEQLLQSVARHEVIAHSMLSEKASTNDQIVGEQTRVERAMDSLDAVDRKLGVTLQFTDEGLASRKRENARASKVREKWQALKLQLSHLTPAASDEQHQSLIADIRTMITHSGDMSNLILDPDLDSYYLMDATLCALPQTQDRMSAMVLDGAEMLKKPTLTVAERTRLAVYAALLQESDLDRVSGSVHTALNEDANFYGTSESLQRKMPPGVDAYATATRAFVEMTLRL
jgi:methyl-accepting chemotaxis protein